MIWDIRWLNCEYVWNQIIIHYKIILSYAEELSFTDSQTYNNKVKDFILMKT